MNITLSLPDETVAKIEKAAQKEERTKSAIVKRAIDKYSRG